MSFILEVLNFVRARKKYWLLPVIFLVVVLSFLIVAVKGSVLAPFIYAVF